MTKIIVDMDEVIVDMMNPLIRQYNDLYQADITIDDITQWELPQDMIDMFHGKLDFFCSLEPLPGVIEGVKKLLEWGHDVVIATNHSGDFYIASQKVLWVQRHLPVLADNMMIGSRKDLLQGDIIIDDNADYLINSPCPIKICMDRPWNRHLPEYSTKPDDIVDGFYVPFRILYRVHNWQDILALFEGGAFKVW